MTTTHVLFFFYAKPSVGVLPPGDKVEFTLAFLSNPAFTLDYNSTPAFSLSYDTNREFTLER